MARGYAITPAQADHAARPFEARNGTRARRYAIEIDAEDCRNGYARHPVEIPLGASRAYRDGWFDAESAVLDHTRRRR